MHNARDFAIERYTSAQLAQIIGRKGQVSVDTTNNRVVVHDGSTAGGITSLTANSTDTLTNKTLSTPLVSGNLVMPNTSGYGIQINTASPAFGWRDLVGQIEVRTTGGTPPSFGAYTGTNYYEFSFSATTDNHFFPRYHMPHDWVPGSAMYIHMHWSNAAATPNTGNVVWTFEVCHAKGFNQEAFGTWYVVSVTQASSATRYQHMVTEVQCSAPGGLIDAGAGAVSITSGAAVLTSANSIFSAADIGRTVRVLGAGAAGAALDTTISAYTSATQVTLAANASTTVTTTDAFRWRVLDASLLEVDGLILCRAYRFASNAADTCSDAVFGHTVDIHYQSTNIGTKNKAPSPTFYA